MKKIKKIALVIIAGISMVFAGDPELDLLQASLDKVKADSIADARMDDSLRGYYATPGELDTAHVEAMVSEITVLSSSVDSLQKIIDDIKPIKQNALTINLLHQEQITTIIKDYHGQQRMILTANLKKLQKEEQKIKYGKR